MNEKLTFHRTFTSCWVRPGRIDRAAGQPLTTLIGNDPELDPERATPQPPTKTVDKTAARTGKRNGPAEAPTRPGAPSNRVGAPKDSGNANDNCTFKLYA